MKVHELKPDQKKIEIIVRAEDKGPERQVALQDGLLHKVCDAIVGDETGCIMLSLWDEKISVVQKGMHYKISNAYTSVFRGSLRLNIGKYGSISETSGSLAVDTANNMSMKEL